ncbi:MAG: glycosyltransferase family 2 protein [Planctomycetota bacterium]|nr:glycosyltransferase family 2 protein [Planctomycetota bacterium]
MFWLGWIVFAFVAVWTIPAVCALTVRKLLPTAPNAQPGSLPSVSVIVPARNEEAQIGNALTTLLQSTGVNLEIIAVNDRSTDLTGQIMDRVSAADSRLKVIHMSQLPDGWLGKNYAMHVASEKATGELLLFTDGDIIYEPAAIEIAVRHFVNDKLQHFCLLPRMLPGSVFENAVVTFFGLAFAVGMQLHLIRTRWPMSYAGVGAFNLVDANFYRSIGGHEPIAMDILDDVKLGKMIKKNGGLIDFQLAPELLSVRWQPSLWGVVTGLEKNGFASLNYSILQVLLFTVIYFLAMVFPYVSPIVLSFRDASGFIATAVVWHLEFAFLATRMPGGLAFSPMFPLGAFVMAFAFWRSTIMTLRQGGVRWRDSFYPLAQLRKGLYK